MGENKKKLTAQNRAEIIIKVRSGFLTATEGASLLGVSRKTYYKWENRALEGLLAGLDGKKAGRPEIRSGTETALQGKIEALEREKQLLQKQMELKDLIHRFEREKMPNGSDIKGSKKKS